VPLDAITGGGGTVNAGFGGRLTAAVDAHGPLCVGIDPHGPLLGAWGLADDADALARFADACVDALAGQVALVKPQSAFFERHGSRGIAVLERLLAAFAGTSTLVLLDVKRGDIGSTMQGYADAYLAPGAPLAADAVTLSPYLGFGSLAPALDTAAAAGRGVFVLARTSNVEGAAVQAAVAEGRSVAQTVVDEAAARNRGAAPLGAVGIVVGATADHGLDLAALNGPVLAPGLGAQGAAPADIAARFREVDGPVLPSASRSVLAAGPDVARLRAAACAVRDELAEALSV
jgi:orotidine-5'-phosphate decarboxylase